MSDDSLVDRRCLLHRILTKVYSLHLLIPDYWGKHFTGKNPRVFPDLTFPELYGVIAQRSQLEKDLFSRILYGSFAFRQGERAY